MRIPKIPGYTDLEQFAGGASSVVYLAETVGGRRPVAIKVLKAPISSERDRRAFERELAAMSRLADHPHIVDLIGSGFTEEGHPFIVMPFYRNGTYGQLVERQGAMAWPEVVDFGVKIASALETAHRRGYVHRDIKPANIYRSEFSGHPLLADFGVSSFVTPGMEGSTTVTVAATPLFCAPEVLNGVRPTTISDIYSLGTTLFGLIEGRAAYSTGSAGSVVGRVTSSAPAPTIETDGVPDDLRRLIARMMSKNPIGRPPSALSVAEALNSIQRQHSLPVTPMVVPDDQADHPRSAGAGVADSPGINDADTEDTDAEDTDTGDPDPESATPGRRTGNNRLTADGSAQTGHHRVDDRERLSLSGQETQSVEALDRPTEPVGEALKPKPARTTPALSRPGWGIAIAVAALALIAIAGYSRFSGADPLSPDTAPPLDLIRQDDRRWQQPALLTTTWSAHDDVVGSLVWSPDGELLATGGRDETVRTWRVGGTETAATTVTLSAWALAIDWSDRGDLVAGDSDGNISGWSADTGTDTDTGTDPITVTGHDGPVETVAWEAGGNRIASGGADGLVRIWSMTGDGPDEIRSMDDHRAPVLSVDWASELPWLASGGQDGKIRIWDAGDGTEVLVIDAHDDWVRSVDWSPRSRALASAGADRTVRVWDGRSGDELRRFATNADPTAPTAWSPSGAILAVGSEDGSVQLWNVAGDRELAAVDAGAAPAATALGWSPTGATLAIGRVDGTVELWSAQPADG